MDSSSRTLREYWDRESDLFENIYTGKNSCWKRFLDRIFRWDIAARFVFTMQHAKSLNGSTVLDVGCGPGIYCLAMAQKGARVIGVDLSSRMIEIARNRINTCGYTQQCEFFEADFREMPFQPLSVDLSIALGVFDYINSPGIMLKKMLHTSRRCIIASFPRSGTWRASLRKIRLKLRGCPVFFYSEQDIRSMIEEAGGRIDVTEIVGQLFCVVASSLSRDG